MSKHLKSTEKLLQVSYEVRFDEELLRDWANWPLSDNEVDSRLQQLREDVRLRLGELGDPKAHSDVEGARQSDQKEWTLSLSTSLSRGDADEAAGFGLTKVHMLLVGG